MKIKIVKKDVSTDLYINDKKIDSGIISYQIIQNGIDKPKIILTCIVENLEFIADDVDLEIKKEEAKASTKFGDNIKIRGLVQLNPDSLNK